MLTEELIDSLDKYAARNHITVSETIRQFIERGLSIETYEQHQSEIRKYIREEIETVLAVQIKPYMDRLIKMQALATRTSAAALETTVSVIAENYVDSATPEEILANALRLATQITRTKPKSDAEYIAEARAWLGVDLGKPNDL